MQPSATFNSFSVEDRPGEQFVRLRHKFSEKEDIKLEATMFDGCVSEPKAGDDADGEDIRLHISLLVDISKGEGSDGLGFVCSAWPDGLEIMKVYMLRENKLLPKAHMGPNTRYCLFSGHHSFIFSKTMVLNFVYKIGSVILSMFFCILHGIS